MNCVYRFGCLRPTEGLAEVRAQLRAAALYQNDLTAIERGRRWAMRQILDTPSVKEAEAKLSQATKTDRPAARKALLAARREAFSTDDVKAELARIEGLAQGIARDARSLTSCYWGTYLSIEAAAQQSRGLPLYQRDLLTPADPKWTRVPNRWNRFLSGQVGVQLQKGLETHAVLGCLDQRVRLERVAPRKKLRPGTAFYILWLRVGTSPSGRAPVWAKVPLKAHRAIPDDALWKWVRLSVRTEGLREQWSCEITIDTRRGHPHTLDTSLKGAIAVELGWYPQDDGSVLAASWRDSDGQTGQVRLAPRLVTGIRKPDGIRAVRDLVLNDLRPKLAEALKRAASREALPPWLLAAAGGVVFWKSPMRFYELASRWRDSKCDAAREAYEILDAWEVRDAHLYDYEAGARGEALRERREFYRVLAAQWARKYRTVLLPDRDLSREAQFGDDSDVRFTTAPQQLRDCLRKAFGPYAHDLPWKGPHGVGDVEDTSWLEKAIDDWRTRAAEFAYAEAQAAAKFTTSAGGAWAKRRAKKAEKEKAA